MNENEQLEVNFDEEEQNNDQDKTKKIEEQKRELLDNVLSGNINSKREKVAFILNMSSLSRNSDIELAWNYWTTFESDLFDGNSITKNQLKKLTGINSLIRIRAKIQNEFKLFQADDIVKKYRGVLEEEKRNEAIVEKPTGLPLYSVFIDEAGKTQQYLIVGSLWIIDGGLSAIKTNREITEWAKLNQIDYEFHFSQVTKHKLNSYKDFFLKFLSLNPTVGFKVIMIQNSGFQELGTAITDLTYHLIQKGIQHENESGRAPLPRILQVWLDDEERGSDILKLENLRERISARKINNLYLGNFEAVASKNNFYIQAVDLFTSSVNRKLHYPNNNGHFKDELADFVLGLLGFDTNNFSNVNTDIDNSIVFNLTHDL